jgi:hypothetical protein
MIKQALARMLVSRQRRPEPAVETLEQKHVDLAKPFPNDSTFFYGSDAAGNAFVTRLAFRGPRRAAECWLDIKPAGRKRFGLPANPGPEREGFALGDLAFVCNVPGREWRIRYKGPLTGENGTTREGSVELAFSGTHPLFDFAYSTDRRLVAAAIAREKWTRRFFLQLQDLGQTHYEQFGQLTGTATFGDEKVELNLPSVRDHSFGSRDWSTWERHYFMSGITADGYGFTAVAIRYDFCGPLYAGFTIAPDGKSDAIVGCTRLEDLTAAEVWPTKGSLALTTRSGARHTVEFKREGVFPYVMDGAYLLREGIGVYTFDGKPAWGVCEFGFKKDKYAHLVA